jgi:hypothetical protein
MTSTTSGLSIRKYVRALRGYAPPMVRSTRHEVRRNLKSKVAKEYEGVDDRLPYTLIHQSPGLRDPIYGSI